MVVIGLVSASAVSAQQYAVDFDALPGGAVVGGQTPAADFSATSGFEIQAFGLNLGSSLPNFICTAPSGGSITCTDPVYVTFPVPVNDLMFFAVGTNNTTRVATARVFSSSVLVGSVDIIGSGQPTVPVLVDLSGYFEIDRLELIDINDPQGIGWDDFSFTVDPAPRFNSPTPCFQSVSANANEPMTFTLDISDDLLSDTVTLSVQGLPTGATFSPALPMVGNPLSSQFSWTPTGADVGLHTLIATAIDDSGQMAVCTISLLVNCTGSDEHYGTGIVGAGGFTPTLSATCSSVGGSVQVTTSEALGGAVGCLLFGLSKASIPIYSGSLLVNPVSLFSHFAGGTAGTAGAGGKDFIFVVPSDPSLSGASFFFQAGYIDPSAPLSVSLTDGLEVIVGS